MSLEQEGDDGKEEEERDREGRSSADSDSGDSHVILAVISDRDAEVVLALLEVSVVLSIDHDPVRGSALSGASPAPRASEDEDGAAVVGALGGDEVLDSVVAVDVNDIASGVRDRVPGELDLRGPLVEGEGSVVGLAFVVTEGALAGTNVSRATDTNGTEASVGALGLEAELDVAAVVASAVREAQDESVEIATVEDRADALASNDVALGGIGASGVGDVGEDVDVALVGHAGHTEEEDGGDLVALESGLGVLLCDLKVAGEHVGVVSVDSEIVGDTLGKVYLTLVRIEKVAHSSEAKETKTKQYSRLHLICVIFLIKCIIMFFIYIFILIVYMYF